MADAPFPPPMSPEVARQFEDHLISAVEHFMDDLRGAPGGHYGFLAVSILGHALGTLVAGMPLAAAAQFRLDVLAVAADHAVAARAAKPAEH